MAVKAHVPQSAAGTNWTSPTNALVEDATVATFPKTVASIDPLKLTNLSNRDYQDGDELVGIVARFVLGGTGGPRGPARGLMTAGAGAATIYSAVDDAANVLDGSDATYYGYASSAVATRATEAIIDLGEAKTVGHVKLFFHFEASTQSGHPTFWSSTDGVSWTQRFIDFGGAEPPLGFGPADVEYSGNLSTTPSARFWKVTVSDGGGGEVAMPRIFRFKIFQTGGSTEVVRTVTMKERVEVAVTLDGSTAASAWRQIEVDAAGGEYTIGDVDDLWSISSLFGSDMNPSTSGLLGRRKGLEDANEVATDRLFDFAELDAYFNPFVYVSMATRPAETQFCILGKETTKGTAVTPTTRLKGARLMFQPQADEEDIRYQGDLLPGDYVNIAEMAEASIDGYPTFDEMGLLLASVFGIPQSELVATGVYRHTFVFDPRGPSNPQTYTHQYGDKNHAEETTYMLVGELGWGWSRKERVSLNGRAIGQKITDGLAGLDAGASAVQTLTISGVPTGGTYRLRFNGQTTTAIAFDADAAAIDAALEALSNIGAGDVLVSGAGPFTITFGGALAGTAMPVIEVPVEFMLLTGGTTPNAVVVITTLGGYTEFRCVPILPGMNTNYYAATLAGLAAGKLSKPRRFNVSAGGRYEDVWWLDASLPSFAEHAEGQMTLVSSMVLNADTTASGIRADVNAPTPKYLRHEFVGPVISGGNTYKLTLDMAVKVRQTRQFSNDGAIYGREFEFGCCFDPLWGRAAQIVLINATASY